MNLQDAIQPLLTERLELRALLEADASALHRVYEDPKTMIYWSDPPSKSVDETRERISKDLEVQEQGYAQFWAVVESGTGEVIGKATLFNFSQQNRRGEIGYILRRSHWGQGVMSEACTALINHWFSAMDLHRIEADADVDNQGSIALLEKLGFQREGLFPERWNVYGQWQDSLMLGLLRRDWESRRAG